jgi:hypothetical protein
MMADNRFESTPDGQFPGRLPRDEYPSQKQAGAFAEHEWLPWALAELSAELDAVTALSAVREQLQAERSGQQTNEARILRRAIDGVFGRVSRIDWSLMADLLESFRRQASSQQGTGRSDPQSLIALLETARASTEQAQRR